MTLVSERNIGPMLYDTLQDQDVLPVDVRERLHREYVDTANQTMLQLHMLEQVLHRLAGITVSVLVVKGASLVQSVYDSLAVRPMGDVDLLFKEEEVDRALQVLREIGYKSAAVSPLFPKMSVPLRKEGTVNMYLDVHWHLFKTPYHQQRIAMDWFWETALPMSVGRAAPLRLYPESELLFLSGHFMQHGGSDEGSDLTLSYDVGVLLNKYAGSLDWSIVGERAQSMGLVVALKHTVGLAGNSWRVALPSDAMAIIDALVPTDEEEDAWVAQTAPGLRFPTLLRALRHRSGVAPGLRHLVAPVFPSPKMMKRWYDVPNNLVLPLYYPYRWYQRVKYGIGDR